MNHQIKVLQILPLILMSILLSPPTSVQAETRYINPSADTVVRRGQGNKYKIIAMAKEGTAVEFLEESNGYSKVRLPNGKEGWVVKRFLSTQPPLDQVVATLQAENSGLQENQTTLNQQTEALSTALANSEEQRNLALQERDQIQNQYRLLQQETADVMQIKTDMKNITAKNTALLQDLSTLTRDNDSLRNDYSFKWFLAGGGVLLFGMIVGGLLKGSRRRKPSLL
jgi:SH3 domain protein